MPAWNPQHYLQFGNERTQPAIDLASRINIDQPKRIIDLGCGPGNSSNVLKQRWPEAHITGIDSSPEMIAAAKESYPESESIVANAASWNSPSAYDIVFSNAALHWIPNHAQLLTHWLMQTAPGGAFAFQIPTHKHSAVHQLILHIADDPEWKVRMTPAKQALTIESLAFYYDVLENRATKLDLWETEYCHIMENSQAIVQWISSTGLRPFLDALDTEGERNRFVTLLSDGVAKAYPAQKNGKVLFPFRRLFVVAYR